MRPLWLALLPLLFALFWLWRKHKGPADWPAYVSPHLMPFLVTQPSKTGAQGISLLPKLWLLSGVLALFALAGPAWQRLPQPIATKVDTLVVALDLSLSMTAQDITPSRIARARFKVQDLLTQRKEGLTGLVVYAGDAHTVVPMTTDTATISALLPSLTPWLMPVKGSRPDLAIAQAIALLEGGTQGTSTAGGHIILLTDALKPSEIDTVKTHLAKTPHRLSILPVGTTRGAPITLPDGQYLKDDDGHLVLPKLDLAAIREFANGVNAGVITLENTDADIRQLLRQPRDVNPATGNNRLLDRTEDIWQDEAFWLVWLLLPLGMMLFRRGYLLTLMGVGLCITLSLPKTSYAFGWADLWQTQDQRAQQAFDQGNYDTASEQFKTKAWRRAAAYRAEQYEQAASADLNSGSAQDHYNRGNALALSGDLPGAIDAYETALAADPDLQDAAYNRDILEKLLAEQENQQTQEQDQQGQNQQDQQQSDEQSEQNAENQGSNNQDQQSAQNQSQQDNSDQDTSDQNNSDQNNSASDTEQQASQSQNDNTQPEDTSEAQAQARAENELDALKDREQQAASSPQQMPENENEPTETPAGSRRQESVQTIADEEQKQALERVIDDPGGLLRRKFILESRKRQRQPPSGDQIW